MECGGETVVKLVDTIIQALGSPIDRYQFPKDLILIWILLRELCQDSEGFKTRGNISQISVFNRATWERSHKRFVEGPWSANPANRSLYLTGTK